MKAKAQRVPVTDDRELLRQHGTVRSALPPSALLNTARADIAIRDRRKAAADARKAFRAGDDTIKPGAMDAPPPRYAFLAVHVEAAKDAADLLTRALASGQSLCRTFNHRIIYGDRDGLEAALKLAEAGS